jgi:DNA-binding Xre family transcriptional regulator
MIISYDNLWKLLIDKKLNKTELTRKIKISSSTMAKMTRGEPVAMTILVKICDELNCDVGDILSIKREDN